MPVTVQQVAEHIAAMDDIPPAKATGIVREVVSALGLAINPSNDEVYDPAHGATRPRYLEDNSRRSYGGRRRR